MKIVFTFFFLAFFAWFRANANEEDFSALKEIAGIYEFHDGVQVKVHASGKINRDYGRGVLVLEKFEVELSGKSISPDRFKKIIPDYTAFSQVPSAAT